MVFGKKDCCLFKRHKPIIYIYIFALEVMILDSKKIRLSTKIKLGIAIFSTIFLIACLFSTPFSDWYTNNIFPFWINTYGRFTSLFPFSFGEKLILVGLILLALFTSFLIYLIISFIFFLFKRIKARIILFPDL